MLGGYPIPGRHRTRLDIMLFEHTELEFPGLQQMTELQRKKWSRDWKDSGARVWRLIEADLREIVPTLNRPLGRANTKGAQADLRNLYMNLCVLDDWMKLADEPEWPRLGGSQPHE